MDSVINKYITKYNFVVNEMVKQENQNLDNFIDLLKTYNKFSKTKVVDSGSVLIIDKQIYKIPRRYSGDDNIKLKRNFCREYLKKKFKENATRKDS